MKVDVVIPTYNRAEKVKRCVESIKKSRYTTHKVYVIEDKSQEMAFGIWNRHLEYLSADAMFYLCDDTELDKECISELIICMQENFPDLDGVVGVNQANLSNGSPSAMGLIGRRFAERFKQRQCFCPDYKSLYADSEMGDYAKVLGKFVFCSKAKLKHYHPSFYKDEMDETHNIVRKWKNDDHRTYVLRRNQGLLWGKNFDLINEQK